MVVSLRATARFLGPFGVQSVERTGGPRPEAGSLTALMRILLLNGPNLNLLGTRSPEIYGTETLADLVQAAEGWAGELGHDLEAYQSNHEGALIDAIQDAPNTCQAIVVNGGAYTHYSYAIHDALEAIDIPTVEVHISNIRDREPWRRHSVTEPAAVYQIFGRGLEGYRDAIRRLHHNAIAPPAAVSYGNHPDQVGDLRLPAGDDPHPIVVLFHGGFWRDEYTRDTLDALAVDLADRGYATWNAEYRRIPNDGGWRAMVDDATAALDAVNNLAVNHPIDTSNVIVLGHSAGGHLATLATKNAATTPKKAVLMGAVLDLELLGSDHEALVAMLGADLDTHQSEVDPTRIVPLGAPSLVVHGERDDVVDLAQAENFVKAAKTAGDDSTLLALPDSDHYDIVDPGSDAWGRIVELLG